jgi:aspartate dehydrogenase
VNSSLPRSLFYTDADAFFALGLDVIVEAAGHDAVKVHGEKALSSGSDFIITSAGVFNEQAVLNGGLSM